MDDFCQDFIYLAEKNFTPLQKKDVQTKTATKKETKPKVTEKKAVEKKESKEDTKKEFKEKFNELAKIKFPKPIILGCSENYKEFFNYALELAALKRAKSTVTAIESDLVAKKELNARMTAYQNLLFNSLTQNFENADWIFNNKKVKGVKKGDNFSMKFINLVRPSDKLYKIVNSE